MSPILTTLAADSDCEPAKPPATTQWTAAIAAGDSNAFGAFYEAWFDRVLAMAKALGRRDEAFCLDVVQDCMMRVVKSMRSMPTEAAVTAWLMRTVHSATVDRLRSETRRRKREEHVAADRAEAYQADPVAQIEADEQTAWLHQEIDQLPELERELLRARFAGELTLEQVGARFGVTGNAAHGRIRRILERLKKAAKE